jgi:hypothetical protein
MHIGRHRLSIGTINRGTRLPSTKSSSHHGDIAHLVDEQQTLTGKSDAEAAAYQRDAQFSAHRH